jgi:hypothetical protein
MPDNTLATRAAPVCSFRRASTSRFLGTAFPLDRPADRVNVDPKVSERACCVLIVSNRREEIADTELSSTVVQGASGGGSHQPTDHRVRGDDLGLRLGGPRDRWTRLLRLGQPSHHRRADRRLVGAKAYEHLHRDPLTVVNQTEENMPGRDFAVRKRQRFAQRKLQRLLGLWCERDRTPGALITRRPDVDHRLNFHHPLTHSISRYAQRAQRPAGVAVGVGEQAQQLMLGPDMPVPQLAGLFLCNDHHPSGGLCEPFEHQRQHPTTPKDPPEARPEKTTPVNRTGVPWIPLRGPGWVADAPASPPRRPDASRSLRSLPLTPTG